MIRRAWAAFARAPMYRVVLAALGVLAGAAFVASFAGALYYTPLELAALLLTVNVVTVAASRVAARIWRAETHDESSLITALLLFFVLKPGLEPADLLAAAAAAAIAGCSKFLIAWRGRHLFNPAALGAFVVTVSGLGASYWWIGSTTLVWVVVPVAAIVVIRIRQTLLASLSVAAGLTVYLISALSWGSAVTDALLMGIGSTALVFFTAFMVVEPLTLPPRRWQRLIVAVTTGALFAAPISLGVVSMSPELALLIGNLLGFAFGQRRAIKLTLRETRRSLDRTVELVFHAETPLRFQPGQAIELHVPGSLLFHRGGTRRVFSIVSAPSDGHEVRVAFTVPEHASAAKLRLAELQPGAVVRATGVAGDFLPPRADAKVVMVAAGIGITPFISWLRDAQSRSERPDAVLVLAVSDANHTHFREELRELPAQVILATPEEPEQLTANERWAGPIRLSGERIEQLVLDLAGREVCVSGRPRFVTEMRWGLRSRAVRVRTDAFAGY